MSNSYTNAEKIRLDEEELNKKVDNLDRNNLPTSNIIVAGITGTGKSTLLNAVFGSEIAKTGKGRPVTENIDEYYSPDIPIHIWDTVGLELDSKKTKDSINSIREIIASKSASNDQFDRIHAIWYCINSGSSRYQGAELEFIKDLYLIGVPFIIVLTQCIGDEEEINAFENKIREINMSMGMNNIDVVQVCAKEFKTRMFTIPAFGLDMLVDTTIQKMPDFIKGGFIAAQKVSKVQKRMQCEEIIYSYIKAAKEGFWDKIPLANIFVANKKIMDMLKKIGEMYNTQIPYEAIEKITNSSGITFENAFFGLVSPIYKSYNNKINMLLKNKEKEGFDVNVGKLTKSDRVANMVAFYGYTFISAIEEVWEKFTEEQLKDMDIVCDNLIRIINRILKDNKRNHKNKNDE